MADKDDSSEKHWRPTRRRRREARRAGEVAKSLDLSSGLTLAAWIGVASLGAKVLTDRLEYMMSTAVHLERTPFPQAMGSALSQAGRTMLFSAFALVLPVAAIATLSVLAQTGPIFAPSRLTFDLGRLNPSKGLGRAFTISSLVELAKALVSAALLVWLFYGTLRDETGDAMALSQGTPAMVLAFLAQASRVLLTTSACAVIGIGLLDAIYQRFAFEKRLLMTRDEFKRDRRIVEGDPRTKRRRRDLFRDWLSHDTIEAVREAAVVVTNPSRLAVAVSYDPQLRSAPIVATKGQGPVAALIRTTAIEVGVPIIQNIPLARALHAAVEVGEMVPESLFVAVAEVIIWANRRRQNAGHVASDESQSDDEPTSAPRSTLAASADR